VSIIWILAVLSCVIQTVQKLLSTVPLGKMKSQTTAFSGLGWTDWFTMIQFLMLAWF
jgi:hypothetical protein